MKLLDANKAPQKRWVPLGTSPLHCIISFSVAAFLAESKALLSYGKTVGRGFKNQIRKKDLSQV